VKHYNHERYRESLQNVTPADVYFGKAQSILSRRERIKIKNKNNRTSTLAIPQSRRLNINQKVSKVSLSLAHNLFYFT